MTRELFDLILKKTNRHFDNLCEALHQTDQTHIVKNLLITPGIMIITPFNIIWLYQVFIINPNKVITGRTETIYTC